MTENEAHIADEFKEMYKALTDPEEREKRAQQTAKRARIEDRKKDTGAYDF